MPNLRQRLEAAERQLLLQGSLMMAMADILAEKGLASREEIARRSGEYTDARLKGFTEDEYQRFKDLGGKLFLPNRNGRLDI